MGVIPRMGSSPILGTTSRSEAHSRDPKASLSGLSLCRTLCRTALAGLFPSPMSHTTSEQQPTNAAPIGLVAGGGRFPVLVAQGLRRRGMNVVCAALRFQADPELQTYCGRYRAFGLGRLGAVLRYFKLHGVREVTWAGWIRKEQLFRPWRLLWLLPDLRTIRIYFGRLKDRQNQTILAALAEEFESEGFQLAHSTKYNPELLAKEGVLSRKRPSASQLADIAFGWGIAKRMADLDVGQSIVVCERSTLAVEGIEGTDNNIRRAGQYYRRGGFCVIKVAKDGHDMRFDVPAVGPDTVESIVESGGAVLAVEAGKTLVLDRDEMTRLADKHGIVVIALTGPPDSEQL